MARKSHSPVSISSLRVTGTGQPSTPCTARTLVHPLVLEGQVLVQGLDLVSAVGLDDRKPLRLHRQAVGLQDVDSSAEGRGFHEVLHLPDTSTGLVAPPARDERSNGSARFDRGRLPFTVQTARTSTSSRPVRHAIGEGAARVEVVLERHPPVVAIPSLAVLRACDVAVPVQLAPVEDVELEQARQLARSAVWEDPRQTGRPCVEVRHPCTTEGADNSTRGW